MNGNYKSKYLVKSALAAIAVIGAGHAVAQTTPGQVAVPGVVNSVLPTLGSFLQPAQQQFAPQQIARPQQILPQQQLAQQHPAQPGFPAQQQNGFQVNVATNGQPVTGFRNGTQPAAAAFAPVQGVNTGTGNIETVYEPYPVAQAAPARFAQEPATPQAAAFSFQPQQIPQQVPPQFVGQQFIGQNPGFQVGHGHHHNINCQGFGCPAGVPANVHGNFHGGFQTAHTDEFHVQQPVQVAFPGPAPVPPPLLLPHPALQQPPLPVLQPQPLPVQPPLPAGHYHAGDNWHAGGNWQASQPVPVEHYHAGTPPIAPPVTPSFPAQPPLADHDHDFHVPLPAPAASASAAAAAAAPAGAPIINNNYNTIDIRVPQAASAPVRYVRRPAKRIITRQVQAPAPKTIIRKVYINKPKKVQHEPAPVKVIYKSAPTKVIYKTAPAKVIYKSTPSRTKRGCSWMTASDTLNLRFGPGVGNRKFCMVPRGTRLKTCGCKGKWCKVKFDGRWLWASKNFLD